ncbi:CaiB/BaiF CoA-transferase family protein [Iamia majanohamensis]|uniref:CaiB/BaiF CoA-transferase family protein n=1 Tax=Iamia majanohamensis TaxID=467976 RepID=A0AAF0BSZ5_9ACTN|nr:CaiB/BaiF CoA-transferase family protein [Iamia majanohamensis]WCO66067.1 CaiB/BaiF CoA-transferase family protein [Iamia majanohamensis]
MLLGDVIDPDALAHGKPLDGVRILALEQMQALPWATQLLARLGADVVKVEAIGTGDQGRGSLPAMTDPEGRRVGATFLRTNLGKRSTCIDLRSERGRQLVLDMAPQFDVVAENFRTGALARLGLAYDDVAAVHPAVVYLSVSGFGHSGSPYGDMPAFAPVVEAMSGIYEMKREGDEPPLVAPVGALGDIGTALFGVIGVLAGLRQRDRTGRGTHVDVAMLDAMVAMTDIVTNFWSMGLRGGELGPLLMHGFRASDGWFIVQVGREHQFARLVEEVGHPEWADDPRFATRQGWLDHLEDVLRPAIEGWAADKTSLEASRALGAVGVAAGPCLSDEQVVADPHVAARDMLVEVPRTDDVDQPVLVPGNPVKMSGVAQGPETRVPWLGEHTDEVLAAELGLDAEALAALRADGVIG